MKDYIYMSKYAGMREDLVQAGGGNSAYKITPEKMAIKASGYQLADVSEEKGYSIVNPQIIRDAFLAEKDIDSMTEADAKRILAEAFIEGERPSIETFLHSISGRYSLHTHPVVVNALTARKDGKHEILHIFPDALVVPYATPGIELAKAYFKEYRIYKERYDREPRDIFLMNHGFITSAEKADQVVEATENATKKIEEYLGVDLSSSHEASKLLKLYPDGILWHVTDYNVLSAFHECSEGWRYTFCPDCVVFLGKCIYHIFDETDRAQFEEFVEKNGYPTVIAHKGNLYIHADSVKKALEIQSVLSFSAQVMRLNKGVECSFLSDQEIDFLLDWDAEKYRKNKR